MKHLKAFEELDEFDAYVKYNGEIYIIGSEPSDEYDYTYQLLPIYGENGKILDLEYWEEFDNDIWDDYIYVHQDDIQPLSEQEKEKLRLIKTTQKYNI